MKELPSSNCARHPGSEGGRSPEAPKPLLFRVKGLLGGSWVVISGLISRATIVLTYVRGRISPLITTHEPPSMVWGLGFGVKP